MLEFREVRLEDKARVENCTQAYSYPLCEHCFTDLFIWRGHYHTRICFWEDFLLVQMQTAEKETMYLAPIGRGDLAAAVSLLVMGTTRTLAGTSYLYPLIPFDWKVLKRLLFRVKR